MNVYDFDGTIYNGDSTLDFFIFSIKSKPSLIRFLPRQLKGFILYKLKRINKREFKEYFFSFLRGIDTVYLVEKFWEKKRSGIFGWYINQQAKDDIIISASPEFLLRPICEILGIDHLIASKVDIQSGKFSGENCRGEEKVKRLNDEYKITHIDNFYSDSHSDLPLAQIADKAFLVKKGVINEWN